MRNGPTGLAFFARFVLPVTTAAACLVSSAVGPVQTTPVLAATGSRLQGSPRSAATSRLRFPLEPGLDEAVAPASYAPHLLRGPYSEAWNYLFTFPNGYTIISRLTITNRGPGDARGAGVALVIDPTGRVTRQVNSRPQDRWTRDVLDDGVNLQLANHQWHMRPPFHRVRNQSGQARFEIEATALTDVYRPGRLRYVGDEFFEVIVLAPRLKASGVLHLGDQVVELRDGSGMAFHTLSNRDDQDQALSWLQFHTFDKDVQVSLWELTAPDEFDHMRAGILLLFDRGRLVRDQATYERVYGDLRRDPESPHYPVPGRLTFDDHTAGQSLHGEAVLKQRHRLEIVDLLNSRFLRFLVRQVMDPVAYEFLGEYDLRVELGGRQRQFNGIGVASLLITEDPPANAPW